ncbi:MAG: restriction endonuclease subunit S [Candidatus Methylomirabilis oxyfera]|nr:restriction endonuclease subunit S [Candidatus Methylomirabilis oxyfera]
MKLATFLEKFDQLADAPNAVEKMRELVLRLAFSGGLTGKRPTADGVPDGWGTRTIESISASISSGFACSRSHQVEGGHVHLRTHNISTLGTLNFDLMVRIDPKMVDPQKASIRAGDILFNNTNSQELVGKTSLVDRDYDYGFSNHITRIRLKDGIFPGFVVFYLTLLRNSGYFARLCTRWINQAAVNTDTLKEQTIPLPPLAEQKRIVAKVEELMALCDRLEAQQQERQTRHSALARASLARFADAPTPANLDFLFHPSYTIPPADLRKTILSLAVQGKLVPQDPNDEPASELLERLSRELSPEKRRRQAAPLQPLPAESLQYELPESWTWARFRDVAIIASNLVNPNEFLDFNHLAPDNIEKGNGVLLPCTTVREDKVISSNHRFYPGQIVYSKIRPNLAKVVVVDFDGLCSADMYPIDALIDAFFFQRYMLSESFLVQAVKTDTRVAMPKINQMELNALAVPVPPLAEQRRIVAKVDQLMALVDQLETQLAASRATAANLLSALVAELTTA